MKKSDVLCACLCLLLLNGDAELLIRIGSSDPCSLDEHLYQQLGLLSRTSLEHHLNLFYAECACYDKKSSDAPFKPYGKNVQSSLHSEEVIKLGCSTIWFAQLQ